MSTDTHKPLRLPSVRPFDCLGLSLVWSHTQTPLVGKLQCAHSCGLIYTLDATVSRPQLTLVRLFPSVFRLASVRLFLCFDLTLHIGRLPRSPTQAHFTASVFEALA